MKQLKRGVTPGPFIESVYLDRSRIYDPDHYAYNLPSLTITPIVSAKVKDI